MSSRTFDIAVGVPAAIVSLPIVAVASLLVIVTSGWPPMVVQTRVGAGEHPIKVPKLRTMRRNVPLVAKSLLERTPNVYTPLGPALRRSSVDELPQLWNVLLGEMSIIGPRPALPTQHDLLAVRRRDGVTALRPGLTGLAQVLGRESLTLSTKVRCESLYARRRSLALDLRILLWTVRAVLFGRGAL